MPEQEKLSPLTDAQLEIMAVIWERGEVTVGEVWREMSARRGLARNTVQTTLTRLEDKGYLRHRSAGNAFIYTPTVPRKAALRRMLRRLVDTAFDGSMEGLVMTLLEAKPMSDREVFRIRQLLDAAAAQRQEDKK